MENGVGICIDIFPVDGLGDSEQEALQQFNKTSIYRELLNARNWERFSKGTTHAWYYEPIRFAFFVLSRFTTKAKLIAKIEDISTTKKFENSTFAGIISGSYRKREVMPKDVYDDYTELQFGNNSFMAIRGFDMYLKRIYGDYMTLPPENKRFSHHTFKAYMKGEN
jgi:lipopolysaccharide cholinephosphotransferase